MPYPTNEELLKLNSMFRKAFKGKPRTFWYHNDIDGLWLYYVRIDPYEGFEDDPEDPPGFNLGYYSVLADEYDIDLDKFLEDVWANKNNLRMV